MVRYADLTTNDPNAVKRFLQRRRLADAIALVEVHAPPSPRVIVDFGAGNGELCKALSVRFPESRIFCYEPAEVWRLEAIANLRGVANVETIGRVDDIPAGAADVLLCMEVFEHLPGEATRQALAQLQALLAADGVVIVGVPIEVFLPALFKGVFRMARRFGEFDATPGAVLRASLGAPPRDRPLSDSLGQGLPFHHLHMGFDHRRFRATLAEYFAIERTVGSPAPWLGSVLNSELYFVARHRARR